MYLPDGNEYPNRAAYINFENVPGVCNSIGCGEC